MAVDIMLNYTYVFVIFLALKKLQYVSFLREEQIPTSLFFL